MHICYVDEAGCTGALPNAASPIQPVFTLVGVIMPQVRVKPLTVDWINLKQRHFPSLLSAIPSPKFHDWMAAEIKGAELRKRAKHSSRNNRRAATKVIDDLLTLIERHEGRLAGRVFVKPIGGLFKGTAVYTATAQSICATFENLLETQGSVGFVIADSRNKHSNANLSHSIFTQRHSVAGDPYPRIVEAPTFGHSDNHAGLQIADIIASALLFPIAAQVCSAEHLTNHMHCDPHFLDLRGRFGARLRALQWQYPGANSPGAGGITLSDQINGYKTPVLFTDTSQPAPKPSALANAMMAAGAAGAQKT